MTPKQMIVIITLIFQIVAILSGLASAFYWWRSSAKPTRFTGELPEDAGEDALAVTVGDTHTVYDFARQAKMSANGAKWAAVSILAQALAAACSAFFTG